jgi:hypothetical protein
LQTQLRYPESVVPASSQNATWQTIKITDDRQTSVSKTESEAFAAFQWTPARLRAYWRSLRRGGSRKRRVTTRLTLRTAWFSLHGLLLGLWTGKRTGMIFPPSYET